MLPSTPTGLNLHAYTIRKEVPILISQYTQSLKKDVWLDLLLSCINFGTLKELEKLAIKPQNKIHSTKNTPNTFHTTINPNTMDLLASWKYKRPTEKANIMCCTSLGLLWCRNQRWKYLMVHIITNLYLAWSKDTKEEFQDPGAHPQSRRVILISPAENVAIEKMIKNKIARFTIQSITAAWEVPVFLTGKKL